MAMRFRPSQPPEGINSPREHPLREASILAAGAVTAVVLLMLAAGALTDLAVHFVPRHTEISVFKPLLNTLMSAGRSRSDAQPRPGAEAALAALVDEVAASKVDMPYDWQVRIYCEPTANALAFPGGGIVVTSGLLDLLQSDNELAFVIGHELGHFEHRDHLRGLGRAVTAALALSVFFGGAGVSSDQLLDSAGRAALAAHSREQEQAADVSGLAALVHRHGHLGGAALVMKKLAEASGESWIDRADILRSHPLGDKRRAAMAEAGAQMGLGATGPMAPLPAALTAVCRAQ